MRRLQMNRAVSGRQPRRATVALLTGMAILAAVAPLAQPAAAADNPAFHAAWERADYPVATGKAARSWLWGPAPFATVSEPLAESPGGTRTVQYYDKARMEINNPNADPAAPGYVTNGLLVVEMMSGQMQVGQNRFEPRPAARIPVAGDSGGTTGPSFATLAKVATLAPGQNQMPDRVGQLVQSTLDAAGNVHVLLTDNSVPKVGHYVAETQHNIPDVFWTFMNASGPVYVGGQFQTGAVFNWVSALGYPLTEAYWIQVPIAGKPTQVLMQAFQRRVLTYNPGNPPAWQVEMGNVGRQYYEWRYGSAAPPPPASGGTALTMRTIDLPPELKQFSNVEQPLYATAVSDSEWQQLITSRFSPPTMHAPVPPAVDFKNEFVVAAFAGQQPNGCATITIQSATVQQATIAVVVSQGPNGSNCPQVITHPVDMAAISRTGLTAASYTLVFKDANGTTLSTGQVRLP